MRSLIVISYFVAHATMLAAADPVPKPVQTVPSIEQQLGVIFGNTESEKTEKLDSKEEAIDSKRKVEEIKLEVKKEVAEEISSEQKKSEDGATQQDNPKLEAEKNVESEVILTPIGSDPLSPVLSSQLASQNSSGTFGNHFAVNQADRIALTPKITGQINPKHWDHLSSSNDIKSYFQWEPGILYAAATLPKGKDLIITLDVGDKGWFSQNNLEIRVSMSSTGPNVQLRKLDVSDRNHPKWIHDSILSRLLHVKASEKDSTWDTELKLPGVYLPKIACGTSIGLRFDAINPGEETPPPYIPRAVSFVTLAMERSQSKYSGIGWNAKYKTRSVARGEKIPIDLIFHRREDDAYETARIQTVGFEKESTTLLEQPFPNFDQRNQVTIRYETIVPQCADTGYRTLQAHLKRGDGTVDVIESSYLVADPVTFESHLPQDLSASYEEQIVKGHVKIKSHSIGRLRGSFRIELPKDWRLRKGYDRDFWIYHSQGSKVINLEFVAPAKTEGLIPIKYLVDVEKYGTIEQTIHLPIRRKPALEDSGPQSS